MAGGGYIAPTVKGQSYNAKMTGYVWGVCIVAGFAGLLLGYDNGIIGGVTAFPDFQQKFFPSVYNALHSGTVNTSPYCKYDDQLLQLVVSSLYLSAAACGLFSARFARAYGRKPVLFVAGIAFLIGTGIMTGAVNVAMLVVGRVLLGVGVGLASMVMPMYLAEVAPPHLRGGMNILFQLNVTIGILAAGLINYGTNYMNSGGWRVSLGLGAVPAVIIILGSLFLPESPNSLMERGKAAEARRILERLRGTTEVQLEIDDIEDAARLAKAVKNPMLNLFRARYRPQLIISLLFMMFQQFAGINAIIFYAPVIFNSIGSGHTAALLNTVIIGAVNVLSTLVAVAFVDKVGRKFLLIAGGIQMIITEVIAGVTLKYMFEKYGSSLPSNVSWGLLVVICTYIAGFAWSWGPIGWLYPTEIQPLETRAAGSAINMASNMIFTFVIGQTFLTMLCSMEWGVFLFFAGMVVIMVTWVIFFLPETKGVAIEDVYLLFKNHWFWGKITHGQVGQSGTMPAQNTMAPEEKRDSEDVYNVNSGAGKDRGAHPVVV